jgi:hypothetical protein
MAGLMIGLAGGFATLVVGPVAAVPEVLLWIVVAAQSPRLFGLAGAVAGHGVAWCILVLTSSMSCASSCFYTLSYGPAHLENGEAWVAETRAWFAIAVGILIAGLVVTVLMALRMRRGPRVG